MSDSKYSTGKPYPLWLKLRHPLKLGRKSIRSCSYLNRSESYNYPHLSDSIDSLHIQMWNSKKRTFIWISTQRSPQTNQPQITFNRMRSTFTGWDRESLTQLKRSKMWTWNINLLEILPMKGRSIGIGHRCSSIMEASRKRANMPPNLNFLKI